MCIASVPSNLFLDSSIRNHCDLESCLCSSHVLNNSRGPIIYSKMQNVTPGLEIVEITINNTNYYAI